MTMERYDMPDDVLGLDWGPDIKDTRKDAAPLFVDCPHPPKIVLEGSGWSVSAGKESNIRNADRNKFHLILNLTGSSLHKGHRIPIPQLAKYEKSHPREMVLNWPDMAAVDLPLQFWKDLMRCVSRWGWKVVVFCIGGHGRTGTALASMLVAKGYGAQQAIDFVRKNHCSKAIETETQERYIYRLAGEPFPEGHREYRKSCGVHHRRAKKTKEFVICCRCGHIMHLPVGARYFCKCCGHEKCILCKPDKP